MGDESIVNCLQPHPTQCLLASSGIDSTVSESLKNWIVNCVKCVHFFLIYRWNCGARDPKTAAKILEMYPINVTLLWQTNGEWTPTRWKLCCWIWVTESAVLWTLAALKTPKERLRPFSVIKVNVANEKSNTSTRSNSVYFRFVFVDFSLVPELWKKISGTSIEYYFFIFPFFVSRSQNILH